MDMDAQYNLLSSYRVLRDTFLSSVNVYKGVLPKSVDFKLQADSEKQIAALPLTEIPPPSTLPDGSRMPLKRNTRFVGRQDELRRLASALKSGETVVVCETTAPVGLGGVGKSELATEFAHRYGCFFSGGVFWLSFAHPQAVVAEVIACGGPAGLNLHPEIFNKLPWDARLRLVAAEWQSSLPILLIFDDCGDEELLNRWHPSIGGSRVLVTSRRGEWSRNPDVKIIPLGPLHREESVTLLKSGRPDLSANSLELNTIAKELEDLPLALHIACSCLEWFRDTELGCPHIYFERLCQSDLLERHSLSFQGEIPNGYDRGIVRAFALIYDLLHRKDRKYETALQLLTYAACFTPGCLIPQVILRDMVKRSDEEIEGGLAYLESLGLIERHDKSVLRLHHVLRELVLSQNGEVDEAKTELERTLSAEAFRLNKEIYPPILSAFFTHLPKVVEHAAERGSEQASNLISEFGFTLCRILEDLSELAAAEAAFRRILAIDEIEFGPEHPRVARDLNGLGWVLYKQMALKEAEATFSRALAIDEAALGPGHPHVARDLNGLGWVFFEQMALKEAEATFSRALAIDEAALGPEHPRVARDLNGLGWVLYQQMALKEAEATFSRALAIDEEALGAKHPHVARDLSGLGCVLFEQEALEEAKSVLSC